MINVREPRFWTALAIAGLGVFAIALALPTLRFGLTMSSHEPTDPRQRLQAVAESPVEALALRSLLVLAPPDKASERVDALQHLVGLTPMAAGAWLDLAIARQDAGQPMERVASALALSALTGPNEERFMAGRASFGLPLWDRLPPDVRRGLIGDLVSGWSAVDDAKRQELNSILTVAPDSMRAEILAALLLVGKSGEPIIAALDLAPAKPSDSQGAGAAPAPGAGNP